MVKLVDVSKHLNRTCILKQCSFHFEAGCKYAISGRNGVGKTTLLNMIAGYQKPDTGKLLLSTQNFQYLFQETLLFSNLTVDENMKLRYFGKCKHPGSDLDQLIGQALQRFQLSGFAPRKVFELSGGEKRKVELAQLFLFSPDILLLDEPTAGLDHESKLDMAGLIGQNFGDKTVIAVSHEDTQIFDGYTKINFMEGGLTYGS